MYPAGAGAYIDIRYAAPGQRRSKWGYNHHGADHGAVRIRHGTGVFRDSE